MRKSVDYCVPSSCRSDTDSERLTFGNRQISFTLDPLRKHYLAGGFLQYMDEAIPDVRAWEALHIR